MENKPEDYYYLIDTPLSFKRPTEYMYMLQMVYELFIINRIQSPSQFKRNFCAPCVIKAVMFLKKHSLKSIS